MGRAVKAEVRQCDAEDAELIADLGRRTFFETYAADTAAEQLQRHLSTSFDLEKVRGELLNTESSFFVVRVSDTTAGFIKLNSGSTQTEPSNKAGLEIESLYVLNEFQGRGIGGLLFDRALQEAEAVKAEYLWLGVWEMNLRGMRFWEKMGFVEQGSHPFAFGDERHRDILMRRELR